MIKLYSWLAYAGTLPFVLGAGCLAAGIDTLPLVGSAERVLSVYALVIGCFMAGSHWGQHLHVRQPPWTIALAIASNCSALALWIAFVLLPPLWLLAAALVNFLALLALDWRLRRANWIDSCYWRTRVGATAIVALSLSVAVWAL